MPSKMQLRHERDKKKKRRDELKALLAKYDADSFTTNLSPFHRRRKAALQADIDSLNREIRKKI